MRPTSDKVVIYFISNQVNLFSLVYFAEKDNPKGPWSFLDSFWWGLMTLTTVGYGDLSPHTFPGKLIGEKKHMVT